jgi:NADPH2:quinone reductase
MRAIVIDESSPERALRWEEVPEPQLGRADLLVAVKATGLNRADLRRAATHFAATDGRKTAAIAGLELAGEVIAVGSEASGFKIGDRVMAMAGSAFAEQAAIDHRFAIRVPASMSWENAAATPISFITAHNALVTAGRFAKGETVLVQGASSGAGIATVQIARFLGASTVFGTAGSPDKLRRLRELGCEVAINYRSEDTAAIVRERTDALGAHVVVDYAGGNTLQKSIDSAAVRGRIVCAGRVAGTEATFNIDEFSRKQLQMTGVTNRTRTLPERIEVVRAFKTDLLTAIESGKLVPVVDSVYPLQHAEKAYQHMNGNTHFGKIVLTL